MNKLMAPLAQWARIFSLARIPGPTGGVASQLMERAGASAGRDPYRSQELLSAAQAFLSVVR